tara:strand:- start:5872 stop:6045 length:174 start_codon:yes stop_codon:yes gene_type:complete
MQRIENSWIESVENLTKDNARENNLPYSENTVIVKGDSESGKPYLTLASTKPTFPRD